jgi:hypothetical protein
MLSTIQTKTNGAAMSRKHASQTGNLSDEKIAQIMAMTVKELNPDLKIKFVSDVLRKHIAPMLLGNARDAITTGKGIAEYCATNKVKKFGFNQWMRMTMSPSVGSDSAKGESVQTFAPEDMAGLVITEMEDSDFNPEMTEDCHNHLVAFFFDEGKECCTFANAQFVARRILCESRINGPEYMFDSEDFSESQGSYGPSEEAWDKYIEPQTASL